MSSTLPPTTERRRGGFGCLIDDQEGQALLRVRARRRLDCDSGGLRRGQQGLGLAGWKVLAVILAAAIGGLASSARGAEPPHPKPDITADVVTQHFAAKKDYRPGDLITRGDVAAALDALDGAGGPTPPRKPILDKAVAEDSFLAHELASPAGRKFMRKISQQPGGYARLERLSTIPRGKSIVRDLVTKPGGEELIEYLSTTPGGRHMGKMMAGTRGGVDLNQPTGRIYTAEDLIAELTRPTEAPRD